MSIKGSKTGLEFKIGPNLLHLNFPHIQATENLLHVDLKESRRKFTQTDFGHTLLQAMLGLTDRIKSTSKVA